METCAFHTDWEGLIALDTADTQLEAHVCEEDRWALCLTDLETSAHSDSTCQYFATVAHHVFWCYKRHCGRTPHRAFDDMPKFSGTFPGFVEAARTAWEFVVSVSCW